MRFSIQTLKLVGLLLLTSLILLLALTQLRQSTKAYFYGEEVMIDKSNLNKGQLNCLCEYACTAQNWNCAVVSCYYDTKNTCSEYTQGECLCSGFGCGRASISMVPSQTVFKCLGGQDEIRKTNTDLTNVEKEITQIRKGIYVFLSKGDKKSAEAEYKRLTEKEMQRFNLLLDVRKDLTDDQKKTVKTEVEKLAKNIRFTEPGEGSKVVTGLFSETLYIDPTGGYDIFYHEIGHKITESLTNKFTLPDGPTEHSFTNFAATEHLALDEALATLISIDITKESTYSSFDEYIGVNLNQIKPKSGWDQEYKYDFTTQTMTVYENSNTSAPQTVNTSNKALYWNWYGPNETQKTYLQNKIAEVDAKLKTESNPDEYKKLMNIKYKALRSLNPPAYSPKSEVAVASVIWDVTGTTKEDERLGRIQKAINRFTEVKGRAPQSEKEFLQGYFLDLEDEKKTEVLGLISGPRHKRTYSLVDLDVIN